MHLVDSHVNLHSDKYDPQEIDRLIESARAAGVSHMLTISDKLDATESIRAITARYDNLWRSVGVHPHYAKDYKGLEADRLIDLARPDDVIGIGECGLDFYYGYSDAQSQRDVFRAHIIAAQETGLALIIHSRDADEMMLEMLRTHYSEKPFRPLLHCYTSGPELAQAAYSMGGYISFSGILTFKNAEEVREIARNAPLDRIIIETDCPYLAPVPHRGRRNEPAYLVPVAQKLAELRGVSLADIAEITTRNFFRCFDHAVFLQTDPGTRT